MTMSFGAIVSTDIPFIYAQISHIVGALLYVVTTLLIIKFNIDEHINSIPDKLWDIYEQGYNDAYFGKCNKDKYSGTEQQWYVDGCDKFWDEFNSTGV